MNRVGVSLLVIAAVWLASVGRGDQSLGQAVWNLLLTYGPPVLAYVVLRALTVRVVLRQMMKRAPGLSDTEMLVAAAPPTQAPTTADLHFLALDSAKGLLLNDVDQDLLGRALETGRRTFRIFWTSILVFAVVSALCLYAFRAATAPPPDASAGTIPLSQVEFASVVWTGAGVLVSIVIALALLFLAATVSNRYVSIGRVPLLSSVLGALLLTALAVAVGRTAGVPWFLYLWPPIASALVVLWGYARIWLRARADGNLTLLILRVFGADRNTAFVFGPLMRSWRFLGAFFTIVDPSYIRYQFSLSSSEMRWKLLRVLGVVGVLIGILSWVQYGLFEIMPTTNPALAAWDELEEGQQARLLGMVVWLLLIPLAVLPVVVIVRARFIRSPADLARQIARVARRGAGLHGVFSGFPLYCYDNVWKAAVNSLLRTADAVLMDVRGFSPMRRGCEYRSSC